jgi:DNA-binding response OmpR family regulator
VLNALRVTPDQEIAIRDHVREFKKRVEPRSALLTLAGRDDATVGERTVDVHISKLRKKLGDDPRAPRRIRTVRGVGYTLARSEE